MLYKPKRLQAQGLRPGKFVEVILRPVATVVRYF
jgi:hypothetical protein